MSVGAEIRLKGWSWIIETVVKHLFNNVPPYQGSLLELSSGRMWRTRHCSVVFNFHDESDQTNRRYEISCTAAADVVTPLKGWLCRGLCRCRRKLQFQKHGTAQITPSARNKVKESSHFNIPQRANLFAIWTAVVEKRVFEIDFGVGISQIHSGWEAQNPCNWAPRDNWGSIQDSRKCYKASLNAS